MGASIWTRASPREDILLLRTTGSSAGSTIRFCARWVDRLIDSGWANHPLLYKFSPPLSLRDTPSGNKIRVLKLSHQRKGEHWRSWRTRLFKPRTKILAVAAVSVSPSGSCHGRYTPRHHLKNALADTEPSSPDLGFKHSSSFPWCPLPTSQSDMAKQPATTKPLRRNWRVLVRQRWKRLPPNLVAGR
jgi:hypothetical protein